jgi:hypothetical protein
MKKEILTVIICLAATVAAFSQPDSACYRSGFHFGLVYPMSTNGRQAPQYTNDVSLHGLAGVSQNERLFTLSGLANIVANDASGFQFAGLYNQVGRNGSGFMFSGLASNIHNNYSGFLFAGLLNRSREMLGFQFAGLFNTTDNITGMQFAGLLNRSREMLGFQFAGLFNATDNITGMQFVGLFNTAGNMTGMQFAGLFNTAGNMTGIQFVGLVNIAGRVKGVQFAGLVNIADSSDYSIALVNIIKNGERGIALTYDETGNITASFRSGGRVTYGIVGAGYNHNAGTRRLFLEGGFGAHINCSARFRVNNELTVANFLFYKNATFKTAYRLHAAYRFFPHAELFAGPSINYMQASHDDHTAIFPSHALWKHSGASKRQQVFVGYQAGVQYIF